MGSSISTPDYEKREEITFTNKAYTVQEDGYIQVYFKYTEKVEIVEDRLFINNQEIFSNRSGVTWQNPISPPFQVKRGDIISFLNKAQQVVGWYYPIRY